MLGMTEEMIVNYCKKEGIKFEEIGYRPDSWITML